MLLTRLGLAGAILMTPIMAQVADNTAKPVAQNEFRLHHGPARDVFHADDGSTTSSNWSGYAVTGSKFKNATGSWIEPSVTCGTGTEYAAFWLGLDGYNNGTVEQTGTLAECVGGKASYIAWYEFYPQEAIVPIGSMTIKPGDRISTVVKFKKKKFTLTITDETTGQHFSKTMADSGAKRSSAEWIAEAPSNGSVLPLANFGTALFGSDSTGVTGTNNATDTAHSGAFNTFPSASVIAITMAKGGTTESVPSAPSSDGSSFSVQWLAQ